jgi:LacI family transcriptional regulator
MVTIYDIAVRCGVSPSTVSKVINNYYTIPEETKLKVRECMKEMNYIPNVSAKSLSKGISRNVGVLCYLGPDTSPFTHPLFVNVLDSFQTEMNANNYDLLFISRLVDGRNSSFYENIVSRNVAGVLLFGDMNNEELKEIIGSSIPKVGFDYFGAAMTGVTSDGFEKMRRMTSYLLNLGHRNIVFIHGETNDVTRSRIEGFKKAISEAGLVFEDSMLEESIFLNKESARTVTEKILTREKKPTAIMYPDDISAVEGLEVIKTFGYSCPKDFSITGFDGLLLSQVVDPTITTVRQDIASMGKILAKKLILAMNDKDTPIEHLEVPATLLIGKSTGIPRS